MDEFHLSALMNEVAAGAEVGGRRRGPSIELLLQIKSPLIDKKVVLEQNDLWASRLNHYFWTSKHPRQMGHLDWAGDIFVIF